MVRYFRCWFIHSISQTTLPLPRFARCYTIRQSGVLNATQHSMRQPKSIQDEQRRLMLCLMRIRTTTWTTRCWGNATYSARFSAKTSSWECTAEGLHPHNHLFHSRGSQRCRCQWMHTILLTWDLSAGAALLAYNAVKLVYDASGTLLKPPAALVFTALFRGVGEGAQTSTLSIQSSPPSQKQHCLPRTPRPGPPVQTLDAGTTSHQEFASIISPTGTLPVQKRPGMRKYAVWHNKVTVCPAISSRNADWLCAWFGERGRVDDAELCCWAWCLFWRRWGWWVRWGCRVMSDSIV